MLEQRGIRLKSIVITPKAFVDALSSVIIEAGYNKWLEYTDNLVSFYHRGFCRTEGCPNSAILYVLCNDCCRTCHGLEIRFVDEGRGVGLFACK